MDETKHSLERPHPAKGTAGEVFGAFLKLGLSSFGGPIAHLAYFRRELVERRAWVSEGQFGQLLALCQFLPGPASSQLGFSLGLLRAGWRGALAAFVAFTLPSAVLLVAFASLLPRWSGELGQAAIHGLKIVAFAVVASAVLGMWKKLCPDRARRLLALAAGAVLVAFGGHWQQLGVVLGGALIGACCCRVGTLRDLDPFSMGYGSKLGAALLVLFVALLLGLPLVAGAGPGMLSMSDAFYQAGALVFGGGHVVLPLLEDSVVTPGWVTQEAFLAGYGASQAIPGPMFSFSAYLGALVPTGCAAWATALVALVMMFLPGFLLVSGVLPLWRTLSHSHAAANAIAGVNAAVVGVLGAALYDPIFTSAIHRGSDLFIGLSGLALLVVWKKPALVAVAWCVVLNSLWTLL